MVQPTELVLIFRCATSPLIYDIGSTKTGICVCAILIKAKLLCSETFESDVKNIDRRNKISGEE